MPRIHQASWCALEPDQPLGSKSRVSRLHWHGGFCGSWTHDGDTTAQVALRERKMRNCGGSAGSRKRPNRPEPMLTGISRRFRSSWRGRAAKGASAGKTLWSLQTREQSRSGRRPVVCKAGLHSARTSSFYEGKSLFVRTEKSALRGDRIP